MAWRLANHVISGELDFRRRGHVFGEIVLAGWTVPIRLELEGCPHRDLAGVRLRFSNPESPKPFAEDGFAPTQVGAVGDMTASRKVKVPTIPIEEIGQYYLAKIPIPYEWGNSIYLEWFSSTNGRVVIEAAGWETEIDPDPTWRMTEAEEQKQFEENAEAIRAFVDRLVEGIDAQAEDPDTPQSVAEAEADREAARMDLLLDRITHRIEREGGDGENFERIMEEERERLRKERGEPEPEPLTPEEEAERSRWIDEMNEIAREVEKDLAENGLPERKEHPLVVHAREVAVRLHFEIDRQKLLEAGNSPEHPLLELSDGVMLASGKLAGALNASAEDDDWPPDPLFAGDTLVRLKKARRHLENALRGLEDAEIQRLAEPSSLSAERREITGILGQTCVLIAEVREVLEDPE